jgi:hypothetical protein
LSDEAQGPPPLTDEDLEATVLRLGSKDEAVRSEAERIVKQAGVEAIETLIATFRREEAAFWTRIRKGFALLSLIFACLVAVGCLLPDKYSVIYVTTCSVFFGSFVLSLKYLRRYLQPSHLLKQTAYLLMGVDDVRAIGPLLEIQCTSGASIRKRISAPLPALIRRLHASDAPLLEERYRAHFRFVLQHWEHIDIGPRYGTMYITAILKALEQIGDARDLPWVERIASSNETVTAVKPGLHWLRSGFNTAFDRFLFKSEYRRNRRPLDRSAIVQAAKECLPYLLSVAEKERASNSLLRASDPGTHKSDGLLRPVTGTESLEPQTLLRAGASGVEDVQ